MDFETTVRDCEWLAHNVVRLEVNKPAGFEYNAGDAIEMGVGGKGPGPLTMTSLPEWDNLEFIVRIYKDHHGLTEAISKLGAGAQIGLTEPFNTFTPKPDSIFLAGGTGITPFIAIMRKLHQGGQLSDCKLFFSNKSRKDLFLEEELREMLGDHFYNVISSDEADPDYYGRINKTFLEGKIKDWSKRIYVCGPPAFDKAMKAILEDIGVKSENLSLSD